MPDKRLPDRSYKRECQETYFAVGSVPTLFCLGIQPNRLNVRAMEEQSSSGLRSCSVSGCEADERILFAVVPYPCCGGATRFLKHQA
jgi:hypothetical protein